MTEPGEAAPSGEGKQADAWPNDETEWLEHLGCPGELTRPGENAKRL